MISKEIRVMLLASEEEVSHYDPKGRLGASRIAVSRTPIVASYLLT